jgi:hypothetical protein
MQKALFSILLALSGACSAAAQCGITCIAPNFTCVCGPATYIYDTAGNRTDRTQVCTCQAATGGRLSNPANGETGSGEVSALTNLTIQPNPTTGKVMVIFETAIEKGSLFVSDATGKQVAAYAVSGSNYELDMNILPGGLYIVTLQTAEKTGSKKLVKTD